MPEKPLRRDPYPDRPHDAEPTAPPWYATRRGIAVVGAYGALALVGGLVASDVVLSGEVLGWDGTYYRTHPLAVPPQVLLYAALGALTYVFTGLAATPDVGTPTLLRWGLRVPVALVVAVPAYLLFVSGLGVVALGDSVGTVRELAGAAFLVGLFVRHAVDGIRTVVVGLFLGRLGRILRRR